MQAIIITLMLMSSSVGSSPIQANQMVATMPKELEVPSSKKIKKSRGKGKGKAPHFAKFF